jgi:hypothetical protein
VNVALLVPRRCDDGWRDDLWRFASAWWAVTFADWTLVEGVHDGNPFNRSAAVNAAAARAGDWDVAVVIDADVVTYPNPVRTAVRIAAATDDLVLAFDKRAHVRRDVTERIVDGERVADLDLCVDHVEHSIWSGCVAVNRALWDRVGGFDERFVGYGFEDIGFVFACWAALGRPHVTLSNRLFHLWHPSAKPPDGDPLYEANRSLCDGYRDAAARATGEPL